MMERVLDCRSAVQQLWDYLDGEMTPDRAMEIEAHLALCSHCHPLFQFERRLKEAVSGARPRQKEFGDLAVRLRAVLRQAGFAPPSQAGG